MPQKNTKRKSNYNSIRSSKNTKTSGLRRIFSNKWIAIAFIAMIASIGSYFVFFSEAAPNNCQNQEGVPICDVDQTLLHSPSPDSFLSVGSEAKGYADKGRGVYFGAAFRAPTKSLNGAVPIYRLYNEKASYHDWVTDSQKAAKEAKYEGVKVQSTAFFAWKTKATGTVPVYRLTRGGSITQSVFSTDKAWVDKMLAVGANDPNGWKKDQFGPFIAFYAYPPNYQVQGQANPFDCSIRENFISDRCQAQRENLEKAVGTGAVPASSQCPTTLDAYLKAVFPGQFSQSCQDKWNNYAKDCSKKENFYSDRCRTARENLVAAFDCSKQENFLSDRCKKERNQLAATYDCTKQENFLSDRCATERAAFANAAARSRQARPPSGGGSNSSAREDTGPTRQQIIDYNRAVNGIKYCEAYGLKYVNGKCQSVPVSSGRGPKLYWVSCNFRLTSGTIRTIEIKNHRYKDPDSAKPRCQKMAKDRSGTFSKWKFIGVQYREG